MRPLKLTPLLQLNIRVIDDQHQQLIDMINQTQDILNHQEDPVALVQILNQLRELTILHFTTEELLMKKYAYPDLKNHKSQHDISAQKTFDFDGAALMDDPSAAHSLLSLLRSWLLTHISEDAEMAKFLREKGAE
ncbi:bacteriohemerythrin [Motiliproteus sp. MSK22-1]|uniref:bacteriohemerythrin n=1 Tax=Motiliproteus sp. MSK22-1 TaxID=1897630 RepID=UPI0009756D44|nr:bacteriohemerythrin [Motiliproteus sp. MSK22-1]OMH39724.1 hypothetical protein BGP75_01290 [Motiliproteus sp. MSK22-1]